MGGGGGERGLTRVRLMRHERLREGRHAGEVRGEGERGVRGEG